MAMPKGIEDAAQHLAVVERQDERHGKNQIILTVYRTRAESAPGAYTYSLQCRLNRFVRSIFPHQIPGAWPTPLDAKRAAASTLRQWTGRSRAAKEHLRGLDLLSVDQLEFDFT